MKINSIHKIQLSLRKESQCCNHGSAVSILHIIVMTFVNIIEDLDREHRESIGIIIV